MESGFSTFLSLPLRSVAEQDLASAKLPVRERTTRRMPGRKTGRRFPAWQNKIWRPPNCQFVNGLPGDAGSQNGQALPCVAEQDLASAKLPVRERTTRRMPGRKGGNPLPAWQNKIWRPPNCRFVNARHGGCRVARRAGASLRGRTRFGARPNCQFVNARHGGCRVGKQTKACRGCWVGKSEKRFVSSSWPFDHRSQCVRALRKVHWTFRSVFDGPLLTYPCRAGDG